MLFRTELHIPPSTFNIKHDQQIFLVGSCFSQNIGERLQNYKFKSISNPFGTIFHPLAIAKILDYTIHNNHIKISDLIFNQGIFVHTDFHSSMGDTDRNAALVKINDTIGNLHLLLKDVKYLFITLGTSIGYRLKSNESIVANCHKLPSDLFIKEDTELTVLAEKFGEALEKMIVINNEIKIILTVSPVRHIKDGIIENQRSKAKLLLLSEIMTNTYKNVHYFPAYEWMMDDLRDYRYYDKDLIHPSEQAIDFIWEKFSNHFFDENTNNIINKIDKIKNALNHRPFNPNSNEHQLFLNNLHNEIDILEKTYAWLKF